MDCPHDQKKLIVSDSEGHVGHVCGSCCGTWLPFSYVESLQGTRKFSPIAFKQHLSEATSGKTTLNCPMGCGNLSIASISGIELDWCASCYGVWFDNGELKKLLLKYPRNSADAVAIYAGVEVAGGVLQFLAAILS